MSMENNKSFIDELIESVVKKRPFTLKLLKKIQVIQQKFLLNKVNLERAVCKVIYHLTLAELKINFI